MVHLVDHFRRFGPDLVPFGGQCPVCVVPPDVIKSRTTVPLPNKMYLNFGPLQSIVLQT